jgi:hypothetical protein
LAATVGTLTVAPVPTWVMSVVLVGAYAGGRRAKAAAGLEP